MVILKRVVDWKTDAITVTAAIMTNSMPFIISMACCSPPHTPSLRPDGFVAAYLGLARTYGANPINNFGLEGVKLRAYPVILLIEA